MNIINNCMCASEYRYFFRFMIGIIFITLFVVIASYSETSSGSCHFIHARKLSGELHAYYHMRESIFQLSSLELTFTSANLPLTLVSVDVYKCHRF